MDKYTRDQMISDVSGLRGKTPASVDVGSSSRLATVPVVLQPPLQLNDHIYEVYKPEGRPSIEIVFFHGLQLEHLTSKDAHITTWLSKDELWLKWLCDNKYFPDARILTISYDPGMTDMYGTCENLVHSIIRRTAQIGQDGCPVVLVGHSLGGMIMKGLCVRAHSMLNELNDEPLDNFLNRVKGLFFYSCPHHGSKLPQRIQRFGKGPLFKDWIPLNKWIERGNEEFRKLRQLQKYGWKTFGIGEIEEVKLRGFKGIVVQEASARHDMDGFSTVASNHIEVSRPRDRQANSFQLLVTFVDRVLKENEHTKAGLLAELELVGLEVVGVEGSVKIIQEKLCGAKRLGIVGMGGIGKSTLAKAVFDEISGSFEYTCFFDDVKDHMAREENPTTLREKIVTKLKNGGRKVKSPFQWRTLKGKSVLIVLDDVKFASQVMVMTDSDGFNQGSRVIVTSRETRFLQDFHLHMMEGLNLDDSKKLFCLHAFKKRVAPLVFEERVTRFAKKCQGLPLALKVSRGYLYNQQKIATWDGAFENLSKAQPLDGSDEDGLWSVLTVSYNSLASQEQQMFLDVATCFYQENLKEVQNAWRACPWASEELGWQNLVDRCLVSRDTGGKISMHEVLRDLGRKIAGHSRVAIQFGSGSCLLPINKAIQLHAHGQEEMATIKVLKLRMSSLLEESRSLSPRSSLLEESRSLSLSQFFCESASSRSGNRRLEPDSYALTYRELANSSYFDSKIFLDFGALSRLKDLRILWLDGILPHGHIGHPPPQIVHLKVRCYRNDDPAKVTGALQQLCEVQSLQSIMLSHSNIRKLPNSFVRLYALEHLELHYFSSLIALPKEFGDLRRLRHLSIRDCHTLKKLPNSFVRLYALEHLELHYFSSLIALPEEFGDLRGLRHLSLCESLIIKLPDSFVRLYALENLAIYFSGLIALPEEFGDLRGLRHLSLGCHTLKKLPDSFVHLCALEHLVLSCHSLKALPEEFGDLRGLRHLSLKGCHTLKRLPDSFVHLCALEHLVLSYHSLEALPEEFGDLRGLRHLSLEGCHTLKKLPDSFVRLYALEHLELSNLSLIALPEEFGDLRGLRHLSLSCSSLKKLPDSFVRLYALERLDIHNCTSLIALPEEFGELRGLLYLSVVSCGSLKELPRSFVVLCALQDLKLKDCKELRVWLSCLRDLPFLQHLDIRGCGKVVSGWYKLSVWDNGLCWELSDFIHKNVDLLSLRELMKATSIGDARVVVEGGSSGHGEICYFGRLSTLPNSMGRIQVMRPRYRGRLANLPKSIGRIQRMRHLFLTGSIQEVPTLILQNCQKLEHLTIVHSEPLQLPELIGQLQALQSLKIQQLGNRKFPWNTLGQLQTLQCLNIMGCRFLEGLPETLWLPQNLEPLTIKDCPGLKAFPESVGELKALVDLKIKGCDSLEALPNTLGMLQNLEHLTIEYCRALKAFPESVGELKALVDLNIKWCDSLEALPNTLGMLQNLEHLTIEGCCGSNAFPESVGQLQALVKLEIGTSWGTWTNLRAFPDALEMLQNLEHLTIEGCYQLTAIPESVGQLRALVKLEIGGCPFLEALPDALVQLENLENLIISDCPRLEKFPTSVGPFQGLRHLEIRGAVCLDALLNTSGLFKNVEKLTIAGGTLKQLPESISNLLGLRLLHITNCFSLEALPNALGHLPRLELFASSGNLI